MRPGEVSKICETHSKTLRVGRPAIANSVILCARLLCYPEQKRNFILARNSKVKSRDPNAIASFGSMIFNMLKNLTSKMSCLIVR